VRYLDPRTSAWCDVFFAEMAPAEGEAILARIAALDVEDPAFRQGADLLEGVMNGWSYWALFVKGYLHWAEASPGPDPYAAYLSEVFGPAGYDPGIAGELTDPGGAERRAVRRYRDLALAREAAAGGPASADDLSPVVVITGEVPSGHPKTIVDAETGRPRRVGGLDGYHRVFAARLFGLARIPCRVVQDLAAAPPAERVA
jgi:hypothetical protein